MSDFEPVEKINYERTFLYHNQQNKSFEIH